MTRAVFAGLALGAMAAVAAPTLGADTYEIDGAHAVVLFQVDHLGFSDFYGRFNDVSGSFTVDDENPAQGSVTVEIQADSVDTANERRDQHLRSPDFLSAKQFPTIRFESSAVRKTDAGYRVDGKLTLRGVTRPVSIDLRRKGPGEDPWGKTRMGFNGSFTIERGDFGVAYMPDALGQKVEILLAIEGVKQ